MKDKLMLGVSVKPITPEVGCRLAGYNAHTYSDAINDDLSASVFVFSQDDTCAALISLTLLGTKSNISDNLRRLIEEKYSIPSENIIVHSIHIHSGPALTQAAGWGDLNEEYLNGIFLPRVLEAVDEAKNNMTAVTVGVASGTSLVGCNRRELTRENQIALGQNPWGPFNPEMTVISFKDLDGGNVANLVHYGCHATASGNNTEITRDWPGVMIDVLSEVSGAPTAFLNGPEGDVGPRLTNGKTWGFKSVRYALELGSAAAQDAVRIFRDIRGYRSAELEVITEGLELPLEPLLDYETAKELYDRYGASERNIDMRKAAYYRRVIELHEGGYENKPSRTIMQTIIRIGDIALVSFPGEPFSEIGMRVAQSSPIPRTLMLALSNGYEGYFVTEDQLCRGGYEIDVFKLGYDQPYADDTDYHIVTGTLENLKKLTYKGELPCTL